jgi:hypothetical protein
VTSAAELAEVSSFKEEAPMLQFKDNNSESNQ